MFRRKIRGNNKTYQLTITIIEAKYLPQNANPMVVVKVGKKKKRTFVRKGTDTPYYNEVCQFFINFISIYYLFILNITYYIPILKIHL